MTDPKLKSYVERIEREEEDIRERRKGVTGIYDEAKDAQYDKKALRRLIADRKREEKDKGLLERVEEYRALLGVLGATYRSVSEETGVPRSTLHRLVPRDKNGTRELVDGDLGEWLPPHDRETGEIIESAHRELVDGDLGDPALLKQNRDSRQFSAKVRALAATVKAPKRIVAPAQPDFDPLRDRPSFLERVRPATDEEIKAQRESWVRGEMAIGSDRDEALYRQRLREGAA